MFLISNKTKEGNHIFPLYLLPDEDAVQRNFGEDGMRPNLHRSFLKLLSSRLGLSQSGGFGLPQGLTAEDLFHYVYAVLHSPGYRSRYAELLKIDFPRLPLTGNLELFRTLARLGSELVALHLLESPKLNKPLTIYTGPPNPEVKRVGWANKAVWLDAPPTPRGATVAPHPGTIGFRGVPEAVWNFHIGGYRVCEKWLKDRKGCPLSEGGHRALPPYRRRPRRNYPADEGSRRDHPAARWLAGRFNYGTSPNTGNRGHRPFYVTAASEGIGKD